MLLYLAMALAAGPTHAQDRDVRTQWYRQALTTIHCDNHSALLGQGQDLEDLVAMFGTTGCDMIQVSAQSNQYATYPTQVGLSNPHAGGYDTIGTFRQVADRLGMKLCIYMSVDRRPIEIAEHPEWQQIGPDGQPQLNSEPIVCQRPTATGDGYLYERFLPQIREIIALYDPDGFWFDGDYILTRPCWCPRCLREWKAQFGTEAPRTPEDEQWQEWVRWHYARFEEYRRLVAETIHQSSPKAMYTSNWSWNREPNPVPDFVDTMSGDAWSIHQVACTAMRCGSQQAVPWDIMSYATPASRDLARRYSLQTTLQEGALTVASGGVWFAWTFGGGEVPAVGIETTRLMADFVRDRAPALGESASLSDVAVLDSETSWRQEGTFRTTDQVSEVARCLQESDYCTDIVNEQTLLQRLTPYRVVVVPGHEALAPETAEELGRLAAEGAVVLLMGAAMADGGEELAGISREGEPAGGPGKLSCAGTEHYVTQRCALQAPGAEIVLRFSDGQPAVTRRPLGKGAVAYLAAAGLPYPDDGLLGTVLRALGAGPSYTTGGAGEPPVVCSLRQRGGQTVLHVTDLSRRVNGTPTDVNTGEYTDRNPELVGLTVSLPMDQAPGAVKAYPALTRVTPGYSQGVLGLTIDRFQTHVAVVIDKATTGVAAGLASDLPVRSARFHPQDTAGGVAFADDFEATAVGQPPAAPWAAENRFGTAISVTDETAASGRRSLRFTEKPGSSFWPYLHRSVPPFKRGRAKLSFDLRVDPDATCLLELRYEGKGPGPSLRFSDEGRVTQGDRELGTFAPGEWFHVEVVVALGGDAPSYRLSVAEAGTEPQVTESIPYATEWFFRCDSVYFVGSGEGEGSFYLDNVHFERHPAGE